MGVVAPTLSGSPYTGLPTELFDIHALGEANRSLPDMMFCFVVVGGCGVVWMCCCGVMKDGRQQYQRVLERPSSLLLLVETLTNNNCNARRRRVVAVLGYALNSQLK